MDQIKELQEQIEALKKTVKNYKAALYGLKLIRLSLQELDRKSVV